MMNAPQTDQAVLNSKYSLVIAVAKRARELVNKREFNSSSAHKPVTIALDEITKGKVLVTLKKPETVTEDEVREPEEAQEAETAEPLL